MNVVFTLSGLIEDSPDDLNSVQRLGGTSGSNFYEKNIYQNIYRP